MQLRFAAIEFCQSLEYLVIPNKGCNSKERLLDGFILSCH